MHKVIEEMIVQPLAGLEYGKLENLQGSVPMFRAKDAGILVTACHHCGEVFGTYSAIMSYLRWGKRKITAVPVVDVRGFAESQSKLSALKHYGFENSYPHLADMIHGYKGASPRKMPWTYGIGVNSVINDMEAQIRGHRAIVDVHNWCADKYMLMTKPAYNTDEPQLLEEISERVSRLVPLVSFEMTARKMIVPGIFLTEHKNTVADYASKNGKYNIVVEVPIGKGRPVDEKYLTRTTEMVLEKIIETIG